MQLICISVAIRTHFLFICRLSLYCSEVLTVSLWPNNRSNSTSKDVMTGFAADDAIPQATLWRLLEQPRRRLSVRHFASRDPIVVPVNIQINFGGQDFVNDRKKTRSGVSHVWLQELSRRALSVSTPPTSRQRPTSSVSSEEVPQITCHIEFAVELLWTAVPNPQIATSCFCNCLRLWHRFCFQTSQSHCQLK